MTCFSQRDEEKMQAFLRTKCLLLMVSGQKVQFVFSGYQFYFEAHLQFQVNEIRVQLLERQMFYTGLIQSHFFVLFGDGWFRTVTCTVYCVCVV